MSEVPSLIGQEVGGRYRIVRLLGEGGMGCVYLGEQKLGATLRKVAIKTLHHHLSHDPKILARFERECETIAELQHPNTIQVYDFGKTDDGTLYIVMEYVEGASVAEILEKEGAMPPARVLKIMQQVCGSLEEAHSRGIIHRDLKPDNVVLCERAGQKDWVEVLDFGIAKRSNETDPNEQKLTQQGMVLGTPPYMSPEQFTGKPIDARSDIYSLGVMAYEMLTGRLPFSGNTAWEWATQHMTARPVAIESLPEGTRVPPAMRAAINRALAKTPDERFPKVRDFIDAFGSDGAAPAYSPPPVESPRQKTEMAMPGMQPGMQGGPMQGAPMQQGAPPQGGYMQTAPQPAMPPQNYAPAPAAPYGTPASGHQAFAASQAGAEKKGPPRGLIIGAIAVVGVISLGLILAGTGVFSKKSEASSGDLFGNAGGSSATATPTTTAAAPTDTATATAAPTNTGTAIPALEPGKKPAATPTGTHTGTTAPPKSSAAPTATATQPAPTATTPPATTPTHPVQVTPPPATPTATTPPPAAHPAVPECDQARRFCNHPAIKFDHGIQVQCASFKSQCFAKGGTL